MKENAMNFEELTQVLQVIDKGDKMKPLNKAIQQSYQELVQKINEYGTNGELIIKLKFVVPKDSKNEIEIIPEVTTKEPKRNKRNRLYRNCSASGLFMDDPNQLHICDVREINSDDKKKMINA